MLEHHPHSATNLLNALYIMRHRNAIHRDAAPLMRF